MHWIPSSPDSWYNLPREGGVGYAAQESWVLNETIRDNIIFDTEFDTERYKKVLYQCALEPDIALFQAGDSTEVGEKGQSFAFFSLSFLKLSFRPDTIWRTESTAHACQSNRKDFIWSRKHADHLIVFESPNSASRRCTRGPRVSSLFLGPGLSTVTTSVHTAQWIVEKCFGGDLVEGRTIILVVSS